MGVVVGEGGGAPNVRPYQTGTSYSVCKQVTDCDYYTPMSGVRSCFTPEGMAGVGWG